MQYPGNPNAPPGYPQQMPPGQYPQQMPGQYPPGAMPPGAYPQGAMPPGAYPPGAYPMQRPGQYPQGYPQQMPGQYPPGAMPPGAYPQGAMPGMQMAPGMMPGSPMAFPFPAYCFGAKRRFQIREKFFTLTGDMKIKDGHSGNEIFVVKQDFSVGIRMHFLDHHTHQEICYIVQEFRMGFPHFDIFRGGMLYATIRFKGNRMQPEFEVDLRHPYFYGQEIKFRGDFLAYNWDVMRQGMLVGLIRKEWFSLTDTYGVEVEPNEDAILILATAIVIDKCLHDDSQGMMGGNMVNTGMVNPGMGMGMMGGGMMGGGMMGGGGFVTGPTIVEEIVTPPVIVENIGFGVPGFGVGMNIGFGGGGFGHHHGHHRGW